LGVPDGADHSWAFDINEAGQVAGQVLLPENNAFRALLWQGGNKLLLSDIVSYASGINNLGQVVGHEVPDYYISTRAVLWEDGEMRDLNVGGGSMAADINDAGQVVGSYTPDLFGPSTAFLWQNEVTTFLPDLGGYGRANAINAAGQIAGDASHPDTNKYHAVLWENGAVLDLGAQASLTSRANDINDLGQVVGFEEGRGAVLWDDLLLRDLNSLIPPGSGWDLREASGINNKGQIVGQGVYNGQSRAFLLSPMTLVVGDVRAEPGTLAGEVDLHWTAPYGEGDAAPTTYDIRTSEAPITEDTWAAATQVQGEPAPGAPGEEELHTVGELSSGVRRYFAIKHRRLDGSWSPLSNVPSLLDGGFRPQTDGYSFRNFGGSLEGDFTYADMIRMFGSQSAVCYNATGPCLPREPATEWRRLTLQQVSAGHCGGMSTTSLRFFKEIDLPETFQPGAVYTHDLTQASIRASLTFYQLRQSTTPWANYRNVQTAKPPSAHLDELMSALSGDAPDPLTLGMWAPTSAHAVTPYAVEERGEEWRIWVYDNNYPDTSTTVAVNPTDQIWWYGSLGWSGSATGYRMAVFAISHLDQTSDCPFCAPAPRAPGAGPQAADPAPTAQVHLTEGGRLLITDSQDRRIGYDGRHFVNEIPGASENTIGGGLGIEIPPIYTLPLPETYRILLDGQTMTRTLTTTLVQFGPGYAAGAAQIPLDPTTLDQVTIAPDGRKVTYESAAAKPVDLLLALDESETQGHRFELRGVDLAAWAAVSAEVDDPTGQLIYRHHGAGDGVYAVAIRRSGAAGQQEFAHGGVAVAAGDIHTLDYGAWDGEGDLLLRIDHGGDGTIDETVPLANRFSRVYLPLVAR
jgi:probable HAF family extracellular repeat protein